MNDRNKTWLSLVFFFSALLFPLAGLLAGWLAIDFKTGLLIGGITFGFYFMIVGLFLTSVKIPSWFAVWLPYLVSIFYTVMPDFVPGPLDDAAAVLIGSILSFFLWIKKQPDTPKWIAIPLISTTAFIILGGFIPGPFDEFIITAILAGTAIIGGYFGSRRNRTINKSPSPGDSSTIILDLDTNDEESVDSPETDILLLNQPTDNDTSNPDGQPDAPSTEI